MTEILTKVNQLHKKLGQRLGFYIIFSAEDMLDKKIASDPYMYKMYLIQFREVLNVLSPAVLKRIFESTFAELYPYYSNSEIMSMSGYDIFKDANLQRLKSDMLALYDKLRITRDIYLNSLGEP